MIINLKANINTLQEKLAEAQAKYESDLQLLRKEKETLESEREMYYSEYVKMTKTATDLRDEKLVAYKNGAQAQEPQTEMTIHQNKKLQSLVYQ